MEHLRRVHAQETADASASPERSVADENASHLDDAASDIGSESGDQTPTEVNIINSGLSQKILLQAKLRELEALKENWVAKIDGDIEAMKRVLSLM
jgi:hypothetical protein